MMAQEASQATEKAYWADEETHQLLNFFRNNHAKMAGSGNFKDAQYNAAAEAIAQYWERGGRKTGAMVKSKWGTVSLVSSDQI
jgi:hypothetical protein